MSTFDKNWFKKTLKRTKTEPFVKDEFSIPAFFLFLQNRF